MISITLSRSLKLTVVGGGSRDLFIETESAYPVLRLRLSSAQRVQEMKESCTYANETWQVGWHVVLAIDRIRSHGAHEALEDELVIETSELHISLLWLACLRLRLTIAPRL